MAMANLMADDWAAALEPVTEELASVGQFLRAEVADGQSYLPSPDHILAAFAQPMDRVKVLIVGQDPYPTPGHPIGLAFSVDRQVRPIPRSLANIYAELHSDLGLAPVEHGDLSAWARQGVLLLNRVLTVRPGRPGSHRNQGWEAITECAIRALAAREKPLVAILWGAEARKLTPTLNPTPCIESVHPSPLSARNGFFGSAPFSRANQLLVDQGATPVNWALD